MSAESPEPDPFGSVDSVGYDGVLRSSLATMTHHAHLNELGRFRETAAPDWAPRRWPARQPVPAAPGAATPYG
ncbi:hypothetical protein GCM10011583_22630 [Streptomyces camponoticapitis]|uniref:Uncharacterized protein n=1 Tax=Streptomyces camponoticapitis TaxID=1616125 RepID=A0ABQ2E2N8_9ACTN|nr:hypothetical protein GCM10011583_22630 [Streptomyces camponoticapitis]